jgi:hypothetical protein
MNWLNTKIGKVLLSGAIGGAIVWWLSVPVTGMREPFDSPGFYYVSATFLAGFAAALPAPSYWWAAPLGVFLGERLYAFTMLPETRDWLAAGIVIGLVTLTWLPAAFGALVTFLGARFLDHRS